MRISIPTNSEQLLPKIKIVAETFFVKPSETTLLWHVYTYHRFTTFVKSVPITYAKNPSYNLIKSYEETFESKHNWFYKEVYSYSKHKAVDLTLDDQSKLYFFALGPNRSHFLALRLAGFCLSFPSVTSEKAIIPQLTPQWFCIKALRLRLPQKKINQFS